MGKRLDQPLELIDDLKTAQPLQIAKCGVRCGAFDCGHHSTPGRCACRHDSRLLVLRRNYTPLQAQLFTAFKDGLSRLLPSSDMIQLKTMVNVIDNSGAAVAECIQCLKMKRHAKIGDRIVVVVQKQRSFGPESGGAVSVSAANKVRRGDIRHAVVVRTKKKYQRPDGSVVRFDDNACVLINKGGEPIGSRMNGVVGKELRDKKWSKILSLAPMHL